MLSAPEISEGGWAQVPLPPKRGDWRETGARRSWEQAGKRARRSFRRGGVAAVEGEVVSLRRARLGAMAESSCFRASSASAQAAMGPPVPYCEGTLSYEPAVMCWCGLKAAKWISWSDDNPGRRYFRCKRSRMDLDCGFFIWIYGECTPFLKNILLDLCNAVWRMKKERAEMQQPVSREIDELKEKNQLLEVENMSRIEELKAIEKKLADKDELVQAMAVKIIAGNRSSSGSLFLVFVVGLLPGMVVGAVVMG